MEYKQRNLVDQMKTVEVMRSIRPISSTAFTLWFEINMQWNRAKWTNSPIPFSFGADTARKMLCGTSSIYRARDALIKKGYIAVKNGKNLQQQAGVYVCYLPQYINQIILDGKCSFDRLQSLIDEGASQEDLQDKIMPNITNRSSAIQAAKQQLKEKLSM